MKNELILFSDCNVNESELVRWLVFDYDNLGYNRREIIKLRDERLMSYRENVIM